MRELIISKLKQIEKDYNVRVLLAVESGSRAWGFASPDSDYDVRFIYVRPETEYLRLEAVRDVIELPVNDELDINGWDLQKHFDCSIVQTQHCLNGFRLQLSMWKQSL